MFNRSDFPNLGFGLGLRGQHFSHILQHWPEVDWFEIISENYMDSGGRPRQILGQVAEHYPVVMHGVSLSIGSSDPLDFAYLKKLKALADRVPAVWVSDHLCWTGVAGLNTHDLLPVPFTGDTLQHIVARIKTVQDFLERPLILENPSSYIEFADSEMHEWEFISEMCRLADCGLLLDVNNVYVGSRNHGWDAIHYIENIPLDRVVQIHLAGHHDNGDHVIDTHDSSVSSAVWELYRHVQCQLVDEPVSTLLEWDANIPDFEYLQAELEKAKSILQYPTIELTSDFISPQGEGDQNGNQKHIPQPLNWISAQ